MSKKKKNRHAVQGPPVRAGGSAASVRRAVNSGYSDSGASWAKRALKAMVPNSNSPQADIDENNLTLRQRARMLYMGAPVATSAIKNLRTNIVGTGLVLKANVDREALGMTEAEAAAWQRSVEREFALWAEDKRACDLQGMNNFYALQQLACMSWALSGDVFVLRRHMPAAPLTPYTLRLQLVEADRVRTPTLTHTVGPFSTIGRNPENDNPIYDGVEVDTAGAVVAYHVANTYPLDLISAAGEPEVFVRVPAYGEETGLSNILHICDCERPGQYRGVSLLAPVIEPLLQLRRFTEAELAAAVVQSFFTAFVTTESPEAMPWNEVDHLDGVPPAENDYQMGPGTINTLKPGEDVKGLDPTHPQGVFDPFVRALCEQIGAALEVPSDMLLKSYNGSYSAARAAILDAWKMFRMRREWLTDDFCRPVYEWWMTEAVASGRIDAPGYFTDPIAHRAYLGSSWIGPSIGTLDPEKELKASVMAIEAGLSTRADEAIKINGSEFERNVERLAVENAMLSAAGGGDMQAAATPQLPEAPQTQEVPSPDET